MKLDANIKTFNEKSNCYESFRPIYPEEIFQFLASNTPEINEAWDCACGTGQVSKSLVEYYKKIKASDINLNQIKNSLQHSRVEFSNQNSEQTDYNEDSFDLVCVAQALHWFSSEKYFKEVKRVLKHKGLFACFGYSFFTINEEIDKIFENLLFAPIKPYWSEKNKLLWNKYKDIDFPFDEITTPEIEMVQYWTQAELIN